MQKGKSGFNKETYQLMKRLDFCQKKNFCATKMIFEYGNRRIEASLNKFQSMSDFKSMFGIPDPRIDIELLVNGIPINHHGTVLHSNSNIIVSSKTKALKRDFSSLEAEKQHLLVQFEDKLTLIDLYAVKDYAHLMQVIRNAFNITRSTIELQDIFGTVLCVWN